MTSFDPKGGERDAEDWQALAFRNASENNNQLKFIGGAILAGMATVAVSPLTGALVAGYCVYSCIKDLHDKGRNRMAVRNYGMVAPFLGDREFNDYARQVVAENGQEKLLEELAFADENGFELSESAYQFIETNAPHLIQESTLPRQLLASSVPVIATQSVDFKREIPDIAKELADTPRLIIYGVPGTGKDYLLAHVNREAKKLHPQSETIFMVDGKDDPKETGYFQGVVDKLYRNFIDPMSAVDVYMWLRNIIEEYDKFDAGTGFKTLCINELAGINGKLGTLPVKGMPDNIKPLTWWVQKLESYASGGDSRGVRLRVASQNGHGTSIKMSNGNKSIFTPVVIVRDCEIGASEMILNADLISRDKKIPSEQMLALCKESPVGRCLFHGGLNEWLPMPKMENFSGYDRDKREFSQRPGQTDALTDHERNQLRSRTATTVNDAPPALPKLSVAEMIKKIESTQAKSVEQFITYDLSALSHMAKLKPAIVKIIRERVELLEKFGLKWLSIDDPIEAMVMWGAGNKSDDELKEAWLLHTEKELNDEGVKLLRGKLG